MTRHLVAWAIVIGTVVAAGNSASAYLHLSVTSFGGVKSVKWAPSPVRWFSSGAGAPGVTAAQFDQMAVQRQTHILCELAVAETRRNQAAIYVDIHHRRIVRGMNHPELNAPIRRLNRRTHHKHARLRCQSLNNWNASFQHRPHVRHNHQHALTRRAQRMYLASDNLLDFEISHHGRLWTNDEGRTQDVKSYASNVEGLSHAETQRRREIL